MAFVAHLMKLGMLPGRSYYDHPDAREIDGTQDPNAGQPSLEDGEEFDEGPWYLGKARDEFNRRRRGHDQERAAQDEEDPVQVRSLSQPYVLLHLLILFPSGLASVVKPRPTETATSVPKTTLTRRCEGSGTARKRM